MAAIKTVPRGTILPEGDLFYPDLDLWKLILHVSNYIAVCSIYETTPPTLFSTLLFTHLEKLLNIVSRAVGCFVMTAVLLNGVLSIPMHNRESDFQVDKQSMETRSSDAFPAKAAGKGPFGHTPITNGAADTFSSFPGLPCPIQSPRCHTRTWYRTKFFPLFLKWIK